MSSAPESSPLLALFHQVWDVIEADGGAARRPVCDGVDELLESPVESFTAGRHLGTCLEAADAAGLEEIADAVRAAGTALPWSQNASYTTDKLGQHFMDNYVSGILTGADGNLGRALPCSAFLMLGPDTHYPAHSHAPREVYLVLTPGTRWTIDGREPFTAAPGEVIYHDSWQGHAMKTGDMPLLAFAAWLDEADRGSIAI